MAVVTLTTDFGVSDAFAGVMKGVMLKINRDLVFVDITHGIDPQNIRQAAYVLWSAYHYFPEGTVHLCVVDPGVGSTRRPIALEAGGHLFVGPDNGVFTNILLNLQPAGVHHIVNKEMMEPVVSNTFHGRDVFAPVAAWLSRGGFSLDVLGPAIDDPVTLDLPSPVQPAPNLIEGSIIYIDRFGNAVTNITRALMEKVGRELPSQSVEIELHAGTVDRILPSYSEAANDKSLHATIGSWNTLELFVANGNAATMHGLAENDRVEVRYY